MGDHVRSKRTDFCARIGALVACCSRQVNLPVGRLLVISAVLALCWGCKTTYLEKEARSGLADDPYPSPPTHLARQLRMLVWPDTVLDGVKSGFEKRYGVKLEVDTFLNNDEAYDSVTHNPSQWDLIMVSQYMADRMRREDLLLPVVRLNSYIYQYIDTSVLNPMADPHMKYFIPFDYAALGISFNVDYLAGFPRTWSYLAGQADNPYLYGRIALPDDMRYALATAMLCAGVDPASATPEGLEAAKNLLIKSVSQLGLRFVPDPRIRTDMVSNNALMAVTWSAEAAGILRLAPSCRFLLPEGKSITTVDGFCLPKAAKSPQTATLFIEYMLHPYNSLLVADETLYASVNMRTMKHVSRFVANSPSSMVARPEDRMHMRHLEADELRAYEDAWAEIKRARFDTSKINMLPLR